MTAAHGVASVPALDVECHPAAALFPLMDWADLADLAADIQEHGQQQPIVTVDGLLLDGRNRWLACRRLGIEPRTTAWDGRGSPVTYVISANLKRRHLTPSQRAACAADALPLFEAEAKDRQRAAAEQTHAKLGRTTNEEMLGANLHQASERASAAAGRAFGVSGRTVATAKQVKEHAPALHDAVKAGQVTVSQAARAIARADNAEVEAGLARIQANDQQLQALRLREAWATAARSLRRNVLALDIVSVVDALTVEDYPSVERVLRDLEPWLSALKQSFGRVAGSGPRDLEERTWLMGSKVDLDRAERRLVRAIFERLDPGGPIELGGWLPMVRAELEAIASSPGTDALLAESALRKCVTGGLWGEAEGWLDLRDRPVRIASGTMRVRDFAGTVLRGPNGLPVGYQQQFWQTYTRSQFEEWVDSLRRAAVGAARRLRAAEAVLELWKKYPTAETARDVILADGRDPERIDLSDII